jgi:hypothetical protein
VTDEQPRSYVAPISWSVVIVVALVSVVLGGYFLLDKHRSAGSKLAEVFADRGQDVSCEKAGVIAVAGGRSTLYRCQWTEPENFVTVTKSLCAVWVDGAAYDVTKEARASAQFTGEQQIC